MGLIEGVAQKWWRLWSLRIIALAAALQVELVLFPDALKSYLPDKWTHAITLGLLFTGAYARLVKQKDPSYKDTH